jgi:hypothetical protein
MTLYRRTSGIYTALGFDRVYRRAGGVYSIAQEALVRSGGAYQNVWRADGPPPAPVGLTASAANGGVVNVGWSYAANVENDYNRVEVQQPGDIARIGTNYAGTSQSRTGYAHGASVSLQARTVDNGGQASAWTTVPTVTALNAAPNAAALTAFFWDGSNWHIRWNDPANPYGDVSAMQVFIRNNAEGTWTLVGSYGWTGQASREVTAAGRGWDTLHHTFVRTVNNAGYTDTGVASQWTPPQPGVEKFINPHEGNSWAYAAGAYRHDGTVREGMFSETPMGLHFGIFFYGNQLYDACHGYPPTTGWIFMVRRGAEGFTGNLHFTGHGYATNPGSAPTGDGHASWVSANQFAGADSSAWETIPSNCLAQIASGVTKGIGIFTFSNFQSNYRVFQGPAFNAYAGVISLMW